MSRWRAPVMPARQFAGIAGKGGEETAMGR